MSICYNIRNILFIYSLCLVSTVTCLKDGNNTIFHASLKEDNSITLHWTVDYSSEMVTFEIHLPSNYGWFAIGFSDRGKLFPADYCLLWVDLEGKISLQDSFANDKGIIQLDKLQDCDGFRLKRRNDVTKFTFKRKFDTCDDKDYIIQDGTTHMVWFRGYHKLYQPSGLNVSSPSGNHGMIRVQLLKNTEVNTVLPPDIKVLDIVVDKNHVPAEETTYWCHVVKIPDEFRRKHHIYQYESKIQQSSQGFVHHMEVFHCETNPDEEIPLYDGNCFASDRPAKTSVCKKVLAAWAMGAPPFIYPEEASLPIGGDKFNLYIMLEIHYNNPELKSGLVDSSGVRFYVSDRLKRMDAGVIELGLEYTDKMAIPPGQELFPLFGYCTSACTAMGLPPEGITIFGSQLHTHLTGARMLTRHIDAHGKELPELNRDDHYSTHFQEIRRLKNVVKVLPGDSLITRCDYNTQDKENITLGGFSISDEMCVNYVHYFPLTDLEVCKSSISDQALMTYFSYMNEWEGQPTISTKGISDNYKVIEWNKIRVQLLREVYEEAPLSMQCNMSSGDRYPGYWENASIPPVLIPLGPPKRRCADIKE
ncbi:unnamed protein product [Phaedon cochleariae]|uniref:DOMON domain-containing protein n=1 Tax=Phaedon cochleariae TaxID=80249 RepID=A0A9P0DNB1_PHACE|nr:unnamed protein product [Phaedon cochleariae]